MASSSPPVPPPVPPQAPLGASSQTEPVLVLSTQDGTALARRGKAYRGFTALVASADELRQASLGSRTGSLLDFWIDVVAGAVSLGLLLLLREHRARKSASREQPAA